jgi:hypothetical protein
MFLLIKITCLLGDAHEGFKSRHSIMENGRRETCPLICARSQAEAFRSASRGFSRASSQPTYGAEMTPYHILLGLILLVFGLKLFWLFVAIAGFLFGMRFGDLILPDQPHWILFLVAL